MDFVRECFLDDGKRTPCLQRSWELRHADGSVVETVLGRLHFDFEPNAKYLSFYFPASQEHVEYPEPILFSQIDELLNIPNGEFGITTDIGGEQVKAGDCVFTGRIYLYSEQPFPDKWQQKLKMDAISRGYRLVFEYRVFQLTCSQESINHQRIKLT